MSENIFDDLGDEEPGTEQPASSVVTGGSEQPKLSPRPTNTIKDPRPKALRKLCEGDDLYREIYNLQHNLPPVDRMSKRELLSLEYGPATRWRNELKAKMEVILKERDEAFQERINVAVERSISSLRDSLCNHLDLQSDILRAEIDKKISGLKGRASERVRDEDAEDEDYIARTRRRGSSGWIWTLAGLSTVAIVAFVLFGPFSGFEKMRDAINQTGTRSSDAGSIENEVDTSVQQSLEKLQETVQKVIEK